MTVVRGLCCKCVAAVLVLGIVACICIVVVWEPGADDPRTGGRKILDRVLLEDARVGRHGYYGIDFVTCGKCRMEKRRFGHLRLGGFNTLVLEDLSVVLPPDDGGAITNGNDNAARQLASKLGVSDQFIKMRGGSLKFSGLRITNLRLATLSPSTNVVPCLVAESGEAKRDGLHLRGCGIITGGTTNYVDRAVLKVRPTLALAWDGGEIDFNR